MAKKKAKRPTEKRKPPSMEEERRPPSAEEMDRALRRRSGFRFDQLVGLAMSGDREALQQCAALAAAFADRLEVGPEHSDLKDWLHSALLDMQAGKSPNDAFGRDASPEGRPPDFMTAVRQRAVVASVESRIAEVPGIKREAVYAEVARVYNVSAATVGTWYRQSRT